ncbi:MAG: rRNA maturation RNase YbeY [Treponema sp.]|jgi:probable rRNA maturation factor|nr:rRNA maturation RNase YbeY [Treponema sp.]
MNRIEITLEGREPPPWLDRTIPFVSSLLERLEKRNWDLSLCFCGDQYIRSLNSRYRNRDEATDVLSFVLGETDGDFFLPGDIVISLDTLETNAAFFGVSPDEELRRLLIHGILHLGGMDHPSSGEEEPMLILQEKLLRDLGDMHILDQEDR